LRDVLHWDDTTLDAVLLDLDDTILDNAAGLETAWETLSRAIATRVGDADEAAVGVQLRASSDWFWGDDARHRWGRMDMPGARRAVIAHVLESLGRPSPALAADLAVLYCELRDASLAPFDGALEALARLRERAPALGLVTNGAASAQRAKVERFDLARFFDVIAVEGEVGIGKPDARVYGHALGALEVAPERALMAGDNYECDVLGALGAGLHAVWLDRRRSWLSPGGVQPSKTPPPRPHATLASFVELVEKLGG
jgi:putative hydrolase of the HAD superfamily